MPQSTAALTNTQLQLFREAGHLTVPGVFSCDRMDQAIADARSWGLEFFSQLDEKGRAWYLDKGVSTAAGPNEAAAAAALRKLDNPVFHRPLFRELASDPALLSKVESIIGPGVSVYFSQIFFKPPEGGGPKPVHQDNYYFGPNDLEGTLTAWIALDDATIENGCLYFGEGTNNGPVYPHVAPADEPFNLQIPADVAARFPMTAAPVSRGGVSFHHGNTFHQSSSNRSTKYRRAVALHYVNHRTIFATPALPYDHSKVVRIS